MPELPEVETVRRVLEDALVGRRLTGFSSGKPTFYRPPPLKHLRALLGGRITGVGRRGKYLLLELSGGRPLTLHLGMSGRLSLGKNSAHVRFALRAQGRTLLFHDPRRFGRVGCPLPSLGPEPLDPRLKAGGFWRLLRGRKAPVKAALLDQATLAGVGNIYATEALYLAGIRPDRPARSLGPERASRLLGCLRRVLQRAIRLGGSTLKDEAFLDPLGRPGKAQTRLAVYGKERGPCGHALRPTPKRLAGRRSLYCPVCQK